MSRKCSKLNKMAGKQQQKKRQIIEELNEIAK